MMRAVQSLANEQQAAISAMQDRHDDPDVLSDLLRIDHMNSQLGRRAQATAVLCGSWPGQHRSASSLTDVVRGATSRIRDYLRVSIPAEADIAVVSRAVEPVVLAVAELLDNGARHSQPNTKVEVNFQQAHNGVVIMIDDAGVGMTVKELQRAARLLAGDGERHQPARRPAPGRLRCHRCTGQAVPLPRLGGHAIALRRRACGGVPAHRDALADQQAHDARLRRRASAGSVPVPLSGRRRVGASWSTRLVACRSDGAMIRSSSRARPHPPPRPSGPASEPPPAWGPGSAAPAPAEPSLPLSLKGTPRHEQVGLDARQRHADARDAERHAAAMSGLQALARNTAEFCDETPAGWQQTVSEFPGGYVFLVAAGPGAYLAVSATEKVDMEAVSFRLQELVQRLGKELTSPPRQDAGSSA
jgi:predicted regulator of Ras-like GTPase activity (Roadblock/LC7/MglB family)